MTSAKKYLILGGAGLVGSAIAAQAVRAGNKIMVIDLPNRIARKQYHPIAGVSYWGEDVFEPGVLAELLYKNKPDVIVNTINVATIFSHEPQKGYQRLVKFYVELYNAITQVKRPLHYVQVGTTGSGGLGFNIPFTHGDTLEDLPIIHKAAFAGVTTALLTLLSRSFAGEVQVSEIKPGLAIFADQIVTQDIKKGVRLVAADGGESGPYTYNELGLLTATMGFTTADSIAKKALAVIQGKRSVRRVSQHDITEAINTTIISPIKADERRKLQLLNLLQKEQTEAYVIATGNLGPPSVTRDLILAYAIIQKLQVTVDEYFFAGLQIDPCIKATCSYIKETNPELYAYLQEACTYQRYQHLAHRVKKQKDPWQVLV
jgi:hypothetical protein